MNFCHVEILKNYPGVGALGAPCRFSIASNNKRVKHYLDKEIFHADKQGFFPEPVNGQNIVRLIEVIDNVLTAAITADKTNLGMANDYLGMANDYVNHYFTEMASNLDAAQIKIFKNLADRVTQNIRDLNRNRALFAILEQFSDASLGDQEFLNALKALKALRDTNAEAV